MNTTTVEETSQRTSTAAPIRESAIAIYKTHADAEKAVHRLNRAGIPMEKISIIGRNFQVREDIQGYYRPSDAAKEGAAFGAWFGGLFGLLFGFGLFILPVAGPLIGTWTPGWIDRRSSHRGGDWGFSKRPHGDGCLKGRCIEIQIAHRSRRVPSCGPWHFRRDRKGPGHS